MRKFKAILFSIVFLAILLKYLSDEAQSFMPFIVFLLILGVLLLIYLYSSRSSKSKTFQRKSHKKVIYKKKTQIQAVPDNTKKTKDYKLAKNFFKKLKKHNYIKLCNSENTEIKLNEEPFILGTKPPFLNKYQKNKSFTALEYIVAKIFYKIKKFEYYESHSVIISSYNKTQIYLNKYINKPYTPDEEQLCSFLDLIYYDKLYFKIGDKPPYLNSNQKGCNLNKLEKNLISAYKLKKKRISNYYTRKNLEDSRIKREEEKRKLVEERARKEEERLKKEYQHGYRNDMDGYQYESYCADLFKYFGWDAKSTKKSGDFGIDIIAKKNNITIVAQCKHYSGAVGFDAVKEVVTGKTIIKADYAIVITNSTYTPNAKKGAKETGVILLRHPDLENWLKTIDRN